MRAPILCRVASVVSMLALAVAAAAPASSAATTTGKALLGRLVVASESHNGSYERTKFRHWIDADGDGCNTRAEVLIKESTRATTRTTGCTIKNGRWGSWYDDRVWTRASDVDIDHVVALKEAWGSGAWSWTASKRQRYANDLGHGWSLDAVTDNVNQSKSDQDPAQWLPAEHRCKYARHWVAVKYRWRLTLNPAEKSALAGILRGNCGALEITIPTRAS